MWLCFSQIPPETLSCSNSLPSGQVAILASCWLSQGKACEATRGGACTLLLSAFPTSLPRSAELSGWVFSLPGCYNYLYRMKALDAIRTSGK